MMAKVKMADDKNYCTKCQQALAPGKEVWLSLDSATGRYTANHDSIPANRNQGIFPFGPDCAKKVTQEVAQ